MIKFDFNEIDITTPINYKCVKTDSEKLNQILGGGLVTNNLIVFQGPSGIGKTTILQRLALNCIDAGEKVMYISAGEQDARELAERFCCMINGYNYSDYVFNRDLDKKAAVIETQAKIADKIQLIYGEEISMTDLDLCLKMAESNGISYVFLDYLGCMTADSEDGQYSYLKKVASVLKNRATNGNQCVITSMQTNRTFDIDYKGKNFDYKMANIEYMAESKGPGIKGTTCITMCRDKLQSNVLHLNVFKNRFTGQLDDVTVYISKYDYKWKDIEVKNDGEIASVAGKEMFCFGECLQPVRHKLDKLKA